jgi:hypothetical protein
MEIVVWNIVFGILALLAFFKIDAIVLYRFIRGHKAGMLKSGNIIFAAVWLLLLCFILYIGLAHGPLNAQWVLLVWIMAYSSAMSILSALRDYNVGGKGIIRAVYVTMIIGTSVALIGYWWAFWPDKFAWPKELVLPAIVSILFLLLFAVLGAYNWLKARWYGAHKSIWCSYLPSRTS